MGGEKRREPPIPKGAIQRKGGKILLFGVRSGDRKTEP